MLNKRCLNMEEMPDFQCSAIKELEERIKQADVHEKDSIHKTASFKAERKWLQSTLELILVPIKPLTQELDESDLLERKFLIDVCMQINSREFFKFVVVYISDEQK